MNIDWVTIHCHGDKDKITSKVELKRKENRVVFELRQGIGRITIWMDEKDFIDLKNRMHYEYEQSKKDWSAEDMIRRC